jgi:hypothetical protein
MNLTGDVFAARAFIAISIYPQGKYLQTARFSSGTQMTKDLFRLEISGATHQA